MHIQKEEKYWWTKTAKLKISLELEDDLASSDCTMDKLMLVAISFRCKLLFTNWATKKLGPISMSIVDVVI